MNVYKKFVREIVNRGLVLLPKYRAIYLKKEKTLIISDIHVGYEIGLAEEGILLPSFVEKTSMRKIAKLEASMSINRIIINGDFKHKFSNHSKRGWILVEKFLKFLLERFEEVLIIRGNHDTFITKYKSLKNLLIFDFYDEIKDIFITHGHIYIDGVVNRNKFVVIGHEHPSITLFDENTGVKYKCQVFLVIPVKDSFIIVLPSFSEIFSGSSLNEVPREEFLSPFIKKHLNEDAFCILCDYPNYIINLKDVSTF